MGGLARSTERSSLSQGLPDGPLPVGRLEIQGLVPRWGYEGSAALPFLQWVYYPLPSPNHPTDTQPQVDLVYNHFLNKWCWNNPSICRKSEAQPMSHILYTAHPPKKKALEMDHWPNGQLKTIKLLEENTRESLSDLGLGLDFLDTTSEKLFVKENIDKCW